MNELSRHPHQIYFERIELRLLPGMRWLDVGCGRKLVPVCLPDGQELEARLRARAGCLVGIDLDLSAVRANRSCTYLLQGAAAALPFAAESFDLVTSNMALEHIAHPRPVLADIRRVMRPGGRLVVHTPNLFDIVTLAARLIPNRWHAPVVSRLEGRAAQDVYPTHYALNRPREVERMLTAAAFRRARIEYLEQPNSYGRVPVIAQVEAFWHRLARRVPALRGTLLIEAEAA